MGEVRYRQALRKKMLPLVVSSEPIRVRAIYDLAVKFYRTGAEIPAAERAEHLYYRLARGDDVDSVRSLITSDLQPYLLNAIDELSPQAQVALAGVFGLVVPESIIIQADLIGYERLAKNDVAQALSSGHISVMARAAHSLQSRTKRSPNSTLRRMEARLYERLGDLQKSQQLTEVAIEDARRAVDFWGEGEMYLLLGRLHERQFQWSRAVIAYRRALAVSLTYNLGQFIAAFILHLRLQKRLQNNVEERFTILYNRANRTLARKGEPVLSALTISRLLPDLTPLLPVDLETDFTNVKDWLWRALSLNSVLPAEKFQHLCAQVLSEETPSLESVSVGITGAYSRFSGVTGGALEVQVFDFIQSLERDGRSTQLGTFLSEPEAMA
jgi:tetratricopeptide (TPR) repeat protein